MPHILIGLSTDGTRKRHGYYCGRDLRFQSSTVLLLYSIISGRGEDVERRMNVSVGAWIQPQFLVIKSAISLSAQELTSWLAGFCMFATPVLSSPGRVEKETPSLSPPSPQTSLPPFLSQPPQMPSLHPTQTNSCIWPAPVISGIQAARCLT